MSQAKDAAGKADVMVHGADLAQSCIRAGVLDELEIHPVAPGSGISLMHGLPEPQRIELISSTAYMPMVA